MLGTPCSLEKAQYLPQYPAYLSIPTIDGEKEGLPDAFYQWFGRRRPEPRGVKATPRHSRPFFSSLAATQRFHLSQEEKETGETWKPRSLGVPSPDAAPLPPLRRGALRRAGALLLTVVCLCARREGMVKNRNQE